MRKGGLAEPVKVAIVRALAAWDSPSVVARAVNEEFGLQLSRQAVERYDPTKAAGAALSAKLRELFHEARQALVEETSKVGAANKAVRVRRLERMADRAEAMGNTAEARACLRQIAEEEGGLLTNARIVRGALNVSTPKSLADFYGMTANEAAQAYADTLVEGGSE